MHVAHDTHDLDSVRVVAESDAPPDRIRPTPVLSCARAADDTDTRGIGVVDFGERASREKWDAHGAEEIRTRDARRYLRRHLAFLY